MGVVYRKQKKVRNCTKKCSEKLNTARKYKNYSSKKILLNQLTILNLFGIEQVLKEDFQSFENCPNLVVKKGATNKLNEVG